MRALVFAEDSGPALVDRPEPSAPGECVVAVRLAGICGTDLELLRGYATFSGVPGHEFVGVVQAAPPGDDAWVGRRVVGEINVGCGRCAWCLDGIRSHCPSRSVVGIRGRAGAFAERLALPAINLHAVPDALRDEQAVFVEPVAAACQILEQVEVSPSSRVAVMGDGRLALLIGQVLRSTGAEVRLFGRHPEKLAVAAELEIHAAPAGDASSALPFDVVVDATGRPEGLAAAAALVRARGTVVLKSTVHGETPLELEAVVVRELTLVGSRCGPFDRAIEMLTSGAVRTDPLVAAPPPLASFDEAFALARRRLKVLLRISDDGHGTTATGRLEGAPAEHV